VQRNQALVRFSVGVGVEGARGYAAEQLAVELSANRTRGLQEGVRGIIAIDVRILTRIIALVIARILEGRSRRLTLQVGLVPVPVLGVVAHAQ
jgi:hypothetical protein